MEEKTIKVSVLDERNYAQIKAWLEDKDASEPDFTESFMTNLYYLYMSRKGTEPVRFRRRTPINVSGIPSLKRLLENVENKTAPQFKAEVINPIVENKSETGPKKNEEVVEKPLPELKASIIGKAIRHCARLYDINIKDSHIQIILYVIYGTRLAKELPDIFREEPQMWKYGPVFPSSFTKLRKPVNIQDDYDAWSAVKAYDAELKTQVINLVSGLGDRKVIELTRKHTSKGTPWYECHKNNPEKWGIKLPASEIKEWFKKQISK